MNDHDRMHLTRCAELAEAALNSGNDPFGSVLVSGSGEVLFEDHNRTVGGDATQHPEIEIARWAAAHLTPGTAPAGHGLHLRRALPDVFGRPRLGGPGTHRVREFLGAAHAVDAGTGRPGRTCPSPVHSGGAAGRRRRGTRALAGCAAPGPARAERSPPDGTLRAPPPPPAPQPASPRTRHGVGGMLAPCVERFFRRAEGRGIAPGQIVCPEKRAD